MSITEMKRYSFRFNRTACFEAEVYASSAEEAYADIVSGKWEHERMVRKPRMKNLPQSAGELKEAELEKIEYVVKALNADIAARMTAYNEDALSKEDAQLRVERLGKKSSDDLELDDNDEEDFFRVSFLG
jgi:hypothetical protein